MLDMLEKPGAVPNRDRLLFATLAVAYAEMEKLQALMATDNAIIALRESVKNASKSQLENGTATTNDYLTNLNAEDQARQNLLLHRTQFLLAQYNYQNTTGN